MACSYSSLMSINNVLYSIIQNESKYLTKEIFFIYNSCSLRMDSVVLLYICAYKFRRKKPCIHYKQCYNVILLFLFTVQNRRKTFTYNSLLQNKEQVLLTIPHKVNT